MAYLLVQTQAKYEMCYLSLKIDNFLLSNIFLIDVLFSFYESLFIVKW